MTDENEFTAWIEEPWCINPRKYYKSLQKTNASNRPFDGRSDPHFDDPLAQKIGRKAQLPAPGCYIDKLYVFLYIYYMRDS